MSVSAHPTPQPGTEEYRSVFVGKTLEQLGEILTRYPTKQAALLPALWLVQEARGWISDRNMAEVAEVLGLTPAYVKGVVTFYTMYHQHPVGKHFVQVCTTSPCNVCGAEAVVKADLIARRSSSKAVIGDRTSPYHSAFRTPHSAFGGEGEGGRWGTRTSRTPRRRSSSPSISARPTPARTRAG